MFCQSVLASVLFYAAVCWERSIRNKDARSLDKLVKKASSVIGARLDMLGEVVERCTRKTLKAILNNFDLLLYNTFMKPKTISTGRLCSLCCKTARYRKSFAPTAIRVSVLIQTADELSDIWISLGDQQSSSSSSSSSLLLISDILNHKIKNMFVIFKTLKFWGSE